MDTAGGCKTALSVSPDDTYEIERLRSEVKEMLTHRSRLLIIRLCDGCERHVAAHNRPEVVASRDQEVLRLSDAVREALLYTVGCFF